jgi:hypothetical protein
MTIINKNDTVDIKKKLEAGLWMWKLTWMPEA